jgi:hypothetical protein
MPSTAQPESVQICIYGATPGGITAAIAAARDGRSVVVVEPGQHLGGMTSGGLGWTDHGVKESIGGLSREFYRRVARHYAASGPGGMDQGDGWSHEPHVAEAIFRDWLREHGVRVVFAHRLSRVERDGARIVAASFDFAPPDHRGAPAPQPQVAEALRVAAGMWIDATYEGDLMALAGVSSATRREGRDEHGESMAGVRRKPVSERGTTLDIDPFVERGRPASGLLPLVEADGDEPDGAPHEAIQAYCFRLCLAQGGSRPVAPPPAYDPARYELLGRYFEACGAAGIALPPGDLYHPAPGRGWVAPRPLKISPLPRGKSDVNNGAPISIDHVGGGSTSYPRASWAERHRIWVGHEDYTRGLLCFLRSDGRIPADLRAEIATWGLPCDEFQDTGGWPHQLYVRECRRMVGRHVMTQHDAERPAPCVDSIGLGSYPLDSHLCRRVAQGGRLALEGGFMHRITGAYPIPYRAITPKAGECANLLVVFCVSATHVAYSSLRMEPVLMILGESAAIAAGLALDGDTGVQDVDPHRLAGHLRELGQVLAV